MDGSGHVLVFAPNESRSHLDDRHLATETSKHLPELKPDVAAADYDQVLGHEVDFHERAIVEKFDLFEARHLGHGCAASDVDENAIGR